MKWTGTSQREQRLKGHETWRGQRDCGELQLRERGEEEVTELRKHTQNRLRGKPVRAERMRTRKGKGRRKEELGLHYSG